MVSAVHSVLEKSERRALVPWSLERMVMRVKAGSEMMALHHGSVKSRVSSAWGARSSEMGSLKPFSMAGMGWRRMWD